MIIDLSEKKTDSLNQIRAYLAYVTGCYSPEFPIFKLWAKSPTTTSPSSYEDSVQSVDSVNILRDIMEREKSAMRKIDDIRNFIIETFKKLKNVDAVYIHPHDDYIEVNTILNSYDRRLRNLVFKNQLKTHDKFPDEIFDFKIKFSDEMSNLENLPENIIICFSK
jgi:hypothetical protein